jgi:hypothetical protein
MSDKRFPEPIDKSSYAETFEGPDGKTYRWDPDYGMWYQVMSREEWDAQTHWQKFNWLYCVVALAIFCYLVEIYK